MALHLSTNVEHLVVLLVIANYFLACPSARYFALGPSHMILMVRLGAVEPAIPCDCSWFRDVCVLII